MKYLKLFMLMVAAVAFTACDDDDKTNSADATVQFANTTLQVKENEGLVNIPVTVNGKLNGKVRINLVTEGTGDNPAKECQAGDDGDYMFTTKTLVVDADTMTTNTINFEMKVLDDNIINPDRTLRLTISAEGAQTGANSTCDVTILNNEKSLYDLFGGQWVLTMKEPEFDDEGNVKTDANGNGVFVDRSVNVTLSGSSDETGDDYGKRLFAYAPTFYLSALGGEVPMSWAFDYNYDETAKKGTLSFNCNTSDVIFSTQGYSFFWQVPNAGGEMTDGEVTGNWTPGENNTAPAEITFAPSSMLMFCGTSGAQSGMFSYYVDLKLTRKN